MLSDKDLNAIDKLVTKRFKEEGKSIRQDTRGIIKAEIKPLEKQVFKMRKNIDIMIKMFDRDYLGFQSRVHRIEKHLRLSPLN